MILRTEIEIPRQQPMRISHSDGIVMLGSCFTDNVGALLRRDGFDVVHNPMGPLYNVASILNAIELALADEPALTLRQDANGVWHCLDFASRYADSDRHRLVGTVTSELADLGARLRAANTVILTLGTSFVFCLADSAQIVGNCHKFPPQHFVRTMLDVDTTTNLLRQIIALLSDKRVILTVSPIRHTADTLHGNQLSKATLQLSIDNVSSEKDSVHYFPSYEIMLDDLRDYRFYAADMKHPSDVAVEYIYEVFGRYYFTPQTLNEAHIRRKEALRHAHRPLSSL